MKAFKIVVMAVVLLASGIFMTSKPANAQTFSDVKEKELYYEAVEHLAKIGVISKSNGKFKPNDRVTRGQLAKMLATALKLDTKNVKNPKFKDVSTSHQFYPYIAALANKKIISGYADGTFGVNKPVTKAHLAKFIVNGFNMPIRSNGPYVFADVKPGTEADKYAGTLYFYRIKIVKARNVRIIKDIPCFFLKRLLP